ncbi:MAG: transposase [Pirellulales bacterium]|nr:transposase [Pirellulales bacterium]
MFCWAHVRRDFIEVGTEWSELKPWALTWLRRARQLYRHRNQRLARESGTAEFQIANVALRKIVADIQTQAATELANPQFREPCRKTPSLFATPHQNRTTPRQNPAPEAGRRLAWFKNLFIRRTGFQPVVGFLVNSIPAS